MTNTALLHELEAAHIIIRNASCLLSKEQREQLDKWNSEEGISGKDTIRSVERLNVICEARFQHDDNVLVERRGRPIEAQLL